MKNDVPCSSCRKPKNQLKPKNSRLLPDQLLWLCETCIKNRFEPRWVIMMVARDEGNLESVKPYIKPKRYVGEPILLEDVV